MERKARGRNDSALPCPICKEDFKNDDQVFAATPACTLHALQPAPLPLRTHPVQVILSCSHVFHAACIRSFERFTGAKACPLCRSRDYQKKRTWGGKELFRERSVLLLQKAFRCARARRAMRHLQDTGPSLPATKSATTRSMTDSVASSTEALASSSTSSGRSSSSARARQSSWRWPWLMPLPCGQEGGACPAH